MDRDVEKVIDLFDKPRVLGLIGDRNTGKSMVLAHLIETLDSVGAKFSLYSYGLPEEFGEGKNHTRIYSIEELETIHDSVIILDEAAQLLDFDSRQKKQQIEEFLRLINHNNNFLIICLLPENAKKFISNKINTFLFKRVTIGDCVNGSFVKRVITSYSGNEKGSFVLSLSQDKALIYNGEHYSKLNIPYYENYDVKKGNRPIVEIPNQGNEYVS